MRYHIISINDDRLVKKQAIHGTMSKFGVERVDNIPSIEGAKYNPNDTGWKPASYLSAGEWGVWMSNIHALCYGFRYPFTEPLIVFEDDAVIRPNFNMAWAQHLPEDWDFAALWVPDNQYADINYRQVYNEIGHPRPVEQGETPYQYRIDNPHFARAYNGYGGVAIAYSKRGADKTYKLAVEQGIEEPYDTWLYTRSHLGELNGYSLLPERQIVDYEWNQHVETTQVHNTPRLEDLFNE